MWEAAIIVRRALAGFLAVVLMLLLCTSVYAEQTHNAVVQKQFDTYSDAYVVIDAATGQVLLEKNMNKREYPASITKILTVALALERGELTDKLVMSKEAVSSVSRSSTHIALTEGEELSVMDAMMATMLASANDAANGLAEHIGGSIEMFCALMNKTAQKAGAYHSNFTNANGLEDDNHYTTAYDMAMITRYALSVEGFREVFGTVEYTMQPTNKQPQSRMFGTQHHMIVYSRYQYKGAWGGKLGWTPQANHTAVTVAERDGRELICVVLNSKTKWEKYKDTKKLFDYCFDNLDTITVSAEIDHIKNIPIIEGESVVGVARLPEQTISLNLYVPEGVTEKDIDISYNTKVSYTRDEEIAPQACFSIMREGGSETEIFSMPLTCEVVLDEQMDVLSATEVVATIEPIEVKKSNTSRVLVIVASILGGLVAAFMLLRIIVQAYYRRKRAKRRAALRYYR